MTELNKMCFELLTELMHRGGGDGDAAIVSEDYKIYADQYEKWVNEKYPGIYTRQDSDNSVVFYDSQESIHFCNDSLTLPTWINNKLWHPWLDREG